MIYPMLSSVIYDLSHVEFSDMIYIHVGFSDI
jgi:hypothetical protein